MAYTNTQVTGIISGYQNTYGGSTTKYWNAGLRNKALSSTNWGVTDTACGSTCTSNVFGAAAGYNVPSQCYGFSLFMAYIIFGDYISLDDINHAYNNSTVCTNWRFYNSNLSQLTLEPGDIIRTSTHSAMVWYTDGSAVKVIECWGTYGCEIAFGNFNGSKTAVSASTILNSAQYILKAPKSGVTPTPSGNTYKITNVGASKCLNITGDNLTSLYNSINVTLWSSSGTNEQKWNISSLGNSVYIKSVIDTAYGLNIYRSGSPYNCNIYKIAGNETDATVDIIVSGNYYKIKAHNYDYYLTVGNSTNGTNVYWAASSTSNYQKWSITEI